MKFGVMSLILGLTVGVILCASFLFPLVGQYTNAELTYENKGTPYAVYDGETHTIVISVDESNNMTITSDGEPCEIPEGYRSSATIVYGEEGYARLALANGNVRVYVSESADSLTPSTGSDVIVTVEPTSITIAKGTTTYTANCTPLAYLASEGDYVLTTSPVVTAEDVIYIGGTTTYGSNYVSYVGYGTIEDLNVTTAFSVPSSDSTVTITGVTAAVNTSTVRADILKIDSVVFTATLSDDSTLTGTFSYFLAPETVTTADPNYIGNGSAALLKVIPLLAGICLIAYAAFAVRGRMDD